MATLVVIVVAVAVLTIRLSFDVPMILGRVCQDAPAAQDVGTSRMPLGEFDFDESVRRVVDFAVHLLLLSQ